MPRCKTRLANRRVSEADVSSMAPKCQGVRLLNAENFLGTLENQAISGRAVALAHI